MPKQKRSKDSRWDMGHLKITTKKQDLCFTIYYHKQDIYPRVVPHWTRLGSVCPNKKRNLRNVKSQNIKDLQCCPVSDVQRRFCWYETKMASNGSPPTLGMRVHFSHTWHVTPYCTGFNHFFIRFGITWLTFEWADSTGKVLQTLLYSFCHQAAISNKSNKVLIPFYLNTVSRVNLWVNIIFGYCRICLWKFNSLMGSLTGSWGGVYFFKKTLVFGTV